MNKILVGIDFSKTSENAQRWAGRLAQTHGAEVILVHGVLFAEHVSYVPSEPSFDQDLLHQVASLLEDAGAALSSLGVTVHTELVHEAPARAILHACENWQPDLVVVGTRGATGWEHLLLGSTAERVLSEAQCPVLAIHPGDDGPDEPVRKILVPTDFSDESRRAAQTAVELFSAGPVAELVALHGISYPVDYGLYPMTTLPQAFVDTIEEGAEREMEKWVEQLDPKGWSVRTRLATGSPYDVITRVADEEDADLVAMGTHGHGMVVGAFLGNAARVTLQKVACPVLTVRRKPQ